MKPAPFAYHAPQTLSEALALLVTHGEAARPLAGGQSLVPLMNARLARPEHLIDINALEGLGFISGTSETVKLGALVRHREIEQSATLRRLCPLLPAAAATIGHLSIRERGTIGGSLALADPAAQWPLMARLLNARIDLTTVSGTRSVFAEEFFLGVFTTVTKADELLIAISFPQLQPGEGWGYRAFARRHGDFAIVAAAVTTALSDSGAVERLRLGLGGIGGAPLALHEVATAWTGRTIGAAAMQEIGYAAAAAVEPPDDLQASAQYRRELVAVLTAEALADALGRSRR